MEDEAVYKENTKIYAQTRDVSKLSEDSQGRIIFKAKIERKGYHFVCRACGSVRYIRPSDIERGRGEVLFAGMLFRYAPAAVAVLSHLRYSILYKAEQGGEVGKPFLLVGVLPQSDV